MTANQPHTLIVTDDYGDGTMRYRVACHGVTDACRTWAEADCLEASPRDEWDDETWFDFTGEDASHGVKHAYIDGSWSHPTDDCWLVVSRDDLVEAACGLRLPPGRYVVTHEYECGGEGAFTLTVTGTLAAP